jgi:hypothetical protein
MGKEKGLEIMKINSPIPHPTPTCTEKAKVPNMLSNMCLVVKKKPKASDWV